jgi:hypothetical protein
MKQIGFDRGFGGVYSTDRKLVLVSPSSSTSSPPRSPPKGIFLGTWKHAGLPSGQSNAVYGSRDRLQRINRRISKVDGRGMVVARSLFHCRKTACEHDDINYIDRFAGLAKDAVDALVLPMIGVAPPTNAVSAPRPPAAANPPGPVGAGRSTDVQQ